MNLLDFFTYSKIPEMVKQHYLSPPKELIEINPIRPLAVRRVNLADGIESTGALAKSTESEEVSISSLIIFSYTIFLNLFLTVIISG